MKRFISNINKNDFRRYFGFSLVFIITIIAFARLELTQARYETVVNINASPTLAFFIVDVESQSGQIKLASMVPRSEPYLYTFNVSNFHGNKHANVDLTYSIEVITTTNMPLEFKIYRGSGSTLDEIDSDTFVTDSNGVYYRRLVINDAYTFRYNVNATDVYTLRVDFPLQYKANPTDYAGIIDLVDIKINAEQVV